MKGARRTENEMDLRADYARGTSSVLLKGKAGEEIAFLISRYGYFLIYVQYEELIVYVNGNQMFFEVKE